MNNLIKIKVKLSRIKILKPIKNADLAHVNFVYASAASRQSNLRGGSNDVYYAWMLIKAIYDIQHFETLYYKFGTYIHPK